MHTQQSGQMSLRIVLRGVGVGVGLGSCICVYSHKETRFIVHARSIDMHSRMGIANMI